MGRDGGGWDLTFVAVTAEDLKTVHLLSNDFV